MGWKKSRSSSSSSKSFFSMFFKHSTSRPQTETVVEAVEPPRHRARVYISDEDGARWVAEPDIDRRAAEFIKNFKDRL